MLSKYETSWNYQDGKRAYSQGDYATALKKFEPLAESGHAESQHYLGVIYEKGRGVAKDDTAAIKWYLKAAQQGNMNAHTRLERIYAKRRDTPQKDEEALQETSLTRQSFFQNLSSRGIELCLSTLETYDVRIEIKDSRFTLLDIERSSGVPVSGSLGLSAPLNTIFDEKLETELDLSEVYSQLNGEVFLTQADIPTLRAFLAGIKADVFVNAPTVFACVKEKLDMAEKIYYEARNELTEFHAQAAGLWNKEIELWRDEIELEDDKWDRKVLNRKTSDTEIIDYLRRKLSFEAHPEDIIYDYNHKIDYFLEALHRLEERTRIENTWQPKEDSEL
ncbi:sel1 repeat family protein, partial [Candidatus Poribacteria bacterium]|nr:sel1 repeat family protein [Candidatus Poribacteria bacterium]